MWKTFEITLDIEKELYTPSTTSFSISQQDLDVVELSFFIKQDDANFDLTGTKVQLAVKKPSSLVVYLDCEIIDAAAGEARVVLTNQAYLEFGIYTAELYVQTDVQIAVTSPFYYFSRTAVMNDEALESQNDWTALMEMMFAYDKKPILVDGIPTAVPEYVGQMAFDTTNKRAFISNDLLATSWQIIGSGEGGGSGIVDWDSILGKPDVFPPAAHTHAIGDVTGLQDELAAKADDVDLDAKADLIHSHAIGDVTGLQTILDAKADEGTPPTAHVHPIADVTGLQAALDAKADDADLAAKADLNHTHTAANITDFGTAVAAAIPAAYLTEAEGDAKYTIKGTTPGTTAAAWGDIAGTLSNQADLQAALDAKADDADLAAKADLNHTHSFDSITDKPSSYPPTAHVHPIADVTGLQTALDGKMDDGEAPTAHVHPIADVTGLQAALDGKVDDAEMAGKSDVGHIHPIGDVTGLQTALDAKADDADLAAKADLNHTHAIADVTGLQTALDGKADDADLAGKSDVGHTHTAANITDFGTAVAGAIPGEYLTETEGNAAYQPKGTYLSAVPLMTGSVVGGAQVGNGLAMSGNYLFVKTLAADGTKIDTVNNTVAIDRATVDAWYAAKTHAHPIGDVTGLQAALDAKADDADLAAKADINHTHAIADVTGLQTALDGKVDDAQMGGTSIWTGTQAAYDAITTKDAATLYFVTG